MSLGCSCSERLALLFLATALKAVIVSVSVINLKIYGKILPTHLQQRIMQKDSTYAPNFERYAESFCISTQYGILGGKIPSINSYASQLVGQASVSEFFASTQSILVWLLRATL